MLKTLLRVIFVLLILIVAGLGSVYFYAGNIVKKAVETFVPQVTQTSASLNKMDVSLFKGEISIDGLALGNPSGFKEPTAFAVQNIFVKFQPETLFQDKIIINKIHINGTHVTAEANVTDGQITSNLTDIQKNVNTFINKNKTTQNAPTSEKKAEPVPNEHSKQVVIRDLQINDSKLTLGALSQTLNITLPNIQKQNIGDQSAQITWKEAIVYIVNLVSSESIKATVSNVQDIVQKQAEALAAEAVAKAAEANEAASGLIEKVKEIF